MRGPSIFPGYFKLPEKTAEAIDAAGWLHTGDVGEWTPSGCLRIIYRKKNIFKLAQGEYVAAEKIENILTQSPLLAQAFVYGDSYQSHLVAILVADDEGCAARFGFGPGDQAGAAGPAPTLAALCDEANAGTDGGRGGALGAAVHEEIARLSSAAKLAGYETVRAVHVESRLFSVDDDLHIPCR